MKLTGSFMDFLSFYISVKAYCFNYENIYYNHPAGSAFL